MAEARNSSYIIGRVPDAIRLTVIVRESGWAKIPQVPRGPNLTQVPSSEEALRASSEGSGPSDREAYVKLARGRAVKNFQNSRGYSFSEQVMAGCREDFRDPKVLSKEKDFCIFFFFYTVI
jgi:hypothetical protein